jgi:hypothetical protein
MRLRHVGQISKESTFVAAETDFFTRTSSCVYDKVIAYASVLPTC